MDTMTIVELAVGAVLALAGGIVVLTKTKTDDKILEVIKKIWKGFPLKKFFSKKG